MKDLATFCGKKRFALSLPSVIILLLSSSDSEIAYLIPSTHEAGF